MPTAAELKKPQMSKHSGLFKILCIYVIMPLLLLQMKGNLQNVNSCFKFFN